MLVKSICYCACVLSLFTAETSSANEELSRWANGINAGRIKECFTRRDALGVQVMNQNGYGIVNLRLHDGGSHWSRPATSNTSGRYTPAFTVPRGSVIVAVQTKTQNGYGLVDLRIGYASRKDVENNRAVRPRWSPWLVRNPNGTADRMVQAFKGYAVVGMDVREQPGHGVVNLRIRMYDIGR